LLYQIFSTKQLNMKKYIIAMTAFLLTAGLVNAQATTKTSTRPAIKTHKSASAKKTAGTTAAVTATVATENKTTSPATIKRKHHKKTKSVPANKN
jgi:fatty-acid desaturase